MGSSFSKTRRRWSNTSVACLLVGPSSVTHIDDVGQSSQRPKNAKNPWLCGVIPADSLNDALEHATYEGVRMAWRQVVVSHLPVGRAPSAGSAAEATEEEAWSSMSVHASDVPECVHSRTASFCVVQSMCLRSLALRNATCDVVSQPLARADLEHWLQQITPCAMRPSQGALGLQDRHVSILSF